MPVNLKIVEALDPLEMGNCCCNAHTDPLATANNEEICVPRISRKYYYYFSTDSCSRIKESTTNKSTKGYAGISIFKYHNIFFMVVFFKIDLFLF